jgi:hypothetical protein
MSPWDRIVMVVLGLGGAITLSHATSVLIGAAAFSFYAGLVHTLMHLFDTRRL